LAPPVALLRSPGSPGGLAALVATQGDAARQCSCVGSHRGCARRCTRGKGACCESTAPASSDSGSVTGPSGPADSTCTHGHGDKLACALRGWLCSHAWTALLARSCEHAWTALLVAAAASRPVATIAAPLHANVPTQLHDWAVATRIDAPAWLHACLRAASRHGQGLRTMWVVWAACGGLELLLQHSRQSGMVAAAVKAHPDRPRKPRSIMEGNVDLNNSLQLLWHSFLMGPGWTSGCPPGSTSFRRPM
jgi:hypothetical protein